MGEKRLLIKVRSHAFWVLSQSQEDKEFWLSLEQGLWEPNTFAVFDYYVTQRSTVIDVGSAAGETTLYLAAAARQVLAIEPDPWGIKVLGDNLDLNPELKNRVLLKHAYLAAQDGSAIFGKGAVFDDVHFTREFPDVLVKGWSWATLLKEAGFSLDDVTLVNMDVEGAEYEIIPALVGLGEPLPTVLLSLHPGFRSRYARFPKIVRRTVGVVERVVRQVKLLIALRKWRYIYDVQSRAQISSMSLLRMRFLKGSSGNQCQILLTDIVFE